MIPWLKSPNVYAIVVILGMSMIIYTAGQRHEARKAESEIAKVNVPLAEMRGRDEAELQAAGEAAEISDAAISGAISQTCVLTAETALLLGRVR